MKTEGWDHLKKASPEEVVKGVSGKDKKGESSDGSSLKCPSCGAMLSVEKKEEEPGE